VLTVLGLVAALTMLIAAVYALFTHDLKRVLAWSTVSQLAYMFGALAVGAYDAGILHLLAHGAFKALLFLAAGSVMHAVGTTTMSAMGGLRDKLPDTFVTMTIGFAALAGVVPFVGFFTKDAVIGATWDAALHGHLVWPWVAWVLFGSTVLTAVLTVAYALRAWLLVFFAPPMTAAGRAAGGPSETAEPHEAPLSMKVPLYLLSIPTLLGGIAVVYPQALFGEGEYHLTHPELAVVMTVLVALTAAVVVWQWRRSGGVDPWHPYVLPHPPVDRVYAVGVVRPVQRLAALVRAGDRDVIDTYADGAGAATRGAGWLLRRAQSGNVQTYLVVVLVGACAVAVAAGVVA
jgi:NADH-quinone oxidoreductase subunit L